MIDVAARSTSPGFPLALLGVPFDSVTMAQAVGMIQEMMRCGRPRYVLTANVDFLVQCRRDEALHRILMQADLVLCDGTPLVWFSRMLGNPLPERVAGSDLVPVLLASAAERPFRLFLLGGSEASNQMAAGRIATDYPSVTVCGRYAPPYSSLETMDHAEILRRIHDATPDLLLVSFGCPKQEKWIAAHLQALRVPVVMGVGATIDFLAGRVPRAPVWMRRWGMEWLFRLAQEPGRLLGRYARDLGVFGACVCAQLWRTRVRGFLVRSAVQPPRIESLGNQHRIVFSGRLDRTVVDGSGALLRVLDQPGNACELDFERVRFIDSTGAGFLLRLSRVAGECRPVLLKPSRQVRSTLRLMRLTRFFRVVA